MVLKLVGLGLGRPEYVTIGAIEAMKRSACVYVDVYTGYVSGELLSFIRSLNTNVVEADRKVLEDGAEKVAREAIDDVVTVAVPGDPLFATTHVSLLLIASNMGVRCEMIHGVSIASAAASSSGLMGYKFGRTATLSRSALKESVMHVCSVVKSNSSLGLHTLVLLDTSGGGMTAGEGAKALMELGTDPIGSDDLVIVLARVGYPEEARWAVKLRDVSSLDLPPPPHCMIFPGELHSTERDAANVMLSGNKELLRNYRHRQTSKERLSNYIEKTSRVIERMSVVSGEEGVREVIDVARSYLEDARIFLSLGRIEDGLLSISYAEGLLDALRRLGKVNFEW